MTANDEKIIEQLKTEFEAKLKEAKISIYNDITNKMLEVLNLQHEETFKIINTNKQSIQEVIAKINNNQPISNNEDNNNEDYHYYEEQIQALKHEWFEAVMANDEELVEDIKLRYSELLEDYNNTIINKE